MTVQDYASFKSATTAEALLIDVARKIQLTPTKHDKAVVSYTALCDYVDRAGSPLEGLVVTCYPSGSFGIGAVVASKVSSSQHDLDVVVELELPMTTPAAVVLGLLYMAIRGEAGSRYYSKTTLNSRCVTVEYDDGFTVDLMPIIRDGSNIDRRGYLSHHKAGEAYQKPVNPYGFKTLYNDTVVTDPAFVESFRLNDRTIVVSKSLVEPMDDHVRLEEKSPRTVALQLMKRFRDLRHRQASRRGQRCVPSVVLAAWSLDKPDPRSSVLWELIEQARYIRLQLDVARITGTLVDVLNPSWREDRFTDRWPQSASEQNNLYADLGDLIVKLEQLGRDVFSPSAAKAILQDLFGETAADYALNEEVARTARAADRGQLKFSPTGAVLSGAAAATSTRAAARPSTDFGGDH